jgi:hypothetical protein
MDSSEKNASLDQNSALVLAAQEIISEKFGRSIEITSIDRITDPDRRNDVYRCIVDPEKEDSSSFVIKKIAGPAFSTNDLESLELMRFFSDWVGAEFLNHVSTGNSICPQFYGGNLQMGFFVLEDLGEHRSLVGPLLDGDAVTAEIALQKYARCLGKLHAMTTGKAERFETLFASKLPGLRPFAYELNELAPRMKNVVSQMEQLGVSTPATLTSEIQTIMDAVSQPGPFLSYIHADPCPDNVFDLGDHFRLIDFEFSHYGHALMDSVYPRMIFTTCWCANRIPEKVVSRFEARYREELIRGCPEAQDDAVWETALVNICGYTALRTLIMHLEDGLKEDSEWGLASIRQRLLVRLQAFILTSEEFHRLPSLRGAAGQLLELLQTRWSETPHLPLYPAFNSAGSE